MSLVRSIEQKINKLSPGDVFSSSQLSLKGTAGERKAISRLEKRGLIRRLDGVQSLYYVPKKGLLGDIKPTRGQIINAIISGRKKGYRTGLSLYNSMGLTTQVSGLVTIATEAAPQISVVAGIKIQFVKSKATINNESIPLLQILDIFDDIKNIPDTTADMVFCRTLKLIKNLKGTSKRRIASLALKYPKRVRALLGATFELIKEDTLAERIKKTLNSDSVYKIGISETMLPNKTNWKIQ